MIINIEKKEVITKLDLNINLKDKEIETFKSIINLAEHEIHSRYVNNRIFDKELDMIQMFKENLK